MGDAGFETEAEVFVEPGAAQVGLALRLAQMMKRADFSAIVRPLPYRGRAGKRELRVSRMAVSTRDELRAQARRFLGVLRM